MKKRILSILLVVAMVAAMIPAFAIAGSAATTRDTSWYANNESTKTYTITKAEELLGFSDLIASGKTFSGWEITLGADIDLNPTWTASATAPDNTWADTTYVANVGGTFSGTFDGNYKTISGIYLSATNGGSAAYTGIFGGDISGATVKNLVIINSYVAGGKYLGAIYGATSGTSNIINVYCDVYVKTLTSSTSDQLQVGGFLGQPSGGTINISNSIFCGTVDAMTATGRAIGGFIGRVNNATANITNSAFYGTVNAKNTGVGSIIGRTENANSKANIENCIVAGNLTNTCSNANSHYNGSFYGQTYAVKEIKITNCYYTELTLTNRTSGAVTYQPIPTYSGVTEPVSGSTYYPVEDTDIVGTLDNVSTLTSFTAIEGGYPRPTAIVEMTKDIHDRNTVWYNASESEFEIAHSSQLLGFSDLLAGGTTFSGKTIKLGADIDLNKGWTAGETAPEALWANVAGKTFSGTFDGQGHEISGVYISTTTAKAGIFGVVVGTSTTDMACIKNLAVTNSYVSNTANHTGGISGGVKYASLENLYVDVDVISTSRYTGGITTDAWNDVIISNCVYVGDVTGTQEVGGIVGWVDTCNLTIKNSAVYGNVVGTSSQGYHSSLIGRIYNRNSNGYTVDFESCIAAGTLTSPVHERAGSFYGAAQTGGTITMTDSYCTRVVLTTDNTEQTKPFPTASGQNVLPDGVTANDFGQDAEYAANRKTNSNFKGINAITPNGFVSMPEGYTMPMGVVNMVYDMNHVSADTAADGFETAYKGYQETVATDNCDLRLIGLVNVMSEDSTLDAEYSGVGFDVEMITASGNKWNNKVDGELPVITTVYTHVQEAGKDEPTAASDLGGDFIFVATVTGIKANVGELTFIVKTFHDELDGTRVYDDVIVITYDTTVPTVEA